MFKANHVSLAIISGVVWLVVGTFLLILGINFLVSSILHDNYVNYSHPLIDGVKFISGGIEPAILILAACCLLIGYLKARVIFSKTVRKSIAHIQSLPNPSSIHKIYTFRYLLLLGCMGFLGYIVRFAPLDVRGAIDIAVGAALMNGAFIYFRQALHLKTQTEEA